jgi:hypothetical protein
LRCRSNRPAPERDATEKTPQQIIDELRRDNDLQRGGGVVRSAAGARVVSRMGSVWTELSEIRGASLSVSWQSLCSRRIALAQSLDLGFGFLNDVRPVSPWGRQMVVRLLVFRPPSIVGDA